ncbi:hypothetical protein J8I26_14660 [Herbaspirillum sp. LeCh32-8]|uniref:hypothetical protein n=1 Tax=Herbaspirillum sp. LeCh32-8 TaxID=2821356 RepID=UPI001AEA4178|nr:hypothetical protein [Herbaspirillum sp. LeCh32-8]MBP0599358.1 hypothetical protein [Herbaspirillum sp. LeCh32-8]
MKAMLRSGLLLGCALALSVCATFKTALPEGYAGPTAVLKDSADVATARKADIFYTLSVNGNEIDNALYTTIRANQGRGMVMTVQRVEHPIRPRR